MHVKDVEKMIKMSKEFNQPGYYADYSKFEKQACKMKIIHKKRNSINPLNNSQTSSTETVDFFA